MPFITKMVKGKPKKIFISDFGKKNSKDVKLLSEGLRVSEVEALSNVDDDILKEIFNDSKHLTKEEMFIAKNRPDLVKKSTLKKVKVLDR